MVVSQFLLSCEGEDGMDGGFDKQIRLDLSGGLGTSSSAGEFIHPGSWLYDFNKNYFVDVDSIVFTSFLKTGDLNVDCLVDLYNITDSTAILSSLISTKGLEQTRVVSENVFKDLPDHSITLAVRIRTAQEGVFVSLSFSELLLYRTE